MVNIWVIKIHYSSLEFFFNMPDGWIKIRTLPNGVFKVYSSTIYNTYIIKSRAVGKEM